MGVITLKIDDKIEQRLRRKAGETHGAAKGAISKSVEEALTLWLSAPRAERLASRKFIAMIDGKKVAEANNLSLLARTLRESGIDPRSVEIRTIPTEPDLVRLGLRTR